LRFEFCDFSETFCGVIWWWWIFSFIGKWKKCAQCTAIDFVIQIRQTKRTHEKVFIWCSHRTFPRDADSKCTRWYQKYFLSNHCVRIHLFLCLTFSLSFKEIRFTKWHFFGVIPAFDIHRLIILYFIATIYGNNIFFWRSIRRNYQDMTFSNVLDSFIFLWFILVEKSLCLLFHARIFIFNHKTD